MSKVYPVADLQLTVNGTTVTADTSGSHALDGKPLALYQLTWGDGDLRTSYTPIVESHTYTTSGRMRLQLTVTDAEGLQRTHTQSIGISGTAPPPDPLPPPPTPTPPPPPATLVSLAIAGPTTATTGQHLSYFVVGTYSDASKQDLTQLATWTSSAPSVATVSLGIVQALTAGTTNIGASYTGIIAPSVTVTVSAPPVALPGVPSSPSPNTGGIGVSTTPTLTWSSLGATSYSVQFGTTNPPTAVFSGLASPSFTPTTLTLSSTYYWRVTAINSSGSTVGPVWSFTTQLAPPPPPPPPTSTTILSASDLTYLGAFNYDTAAIYSATGGADPTFARGLALRTVGGDTRLFTMAWNPQAIVEMTVPTSLGATPATGPTATLVRSWGNTQTANWTTVGPSTGTQGFGLFWDATDSRLYWSYGNIYNANGTIDPSIGYSTLNDGTGVQTPNGPWIVSSSEKYAMGGMLAIPSWFASAYTGGKRLGVGFGGYWSIVATGPASMGPALGAIDPASGSPMSTLANVPLMNYPYGATPYSLPDRMHRADLDYINNFDGWNPKNGVGYYDWTDFIWQGGTWVDTPTKSGLLIFTVNGNGNTFYQTSTLHAERCSHWINEYDPADLALVAQGTKQPSEIQPAAQWAIQFPGLTYPLAGWADEPANMITGTAFDSTTNRLYVAVRFAGPNGATAVYVYQVQAPTPPPPVAGTPVHAGADLQKAINAAKPGDTLVLDAGALYTGNYILPVKSGTTPITITSNTALPPPGTRVSPTTAANFAKIQAIKGGLSAIATAPSAAHWNLVGLEFLGNPGGFGIIVQLGDGSPAQNSLDLIPHDILIDRCYIHGDPAVGQKVGVTLNASAVTVKNCYISDIKLKGQDSQALAGVNTPGTIVIDNNYLEAGAENILFGGDDARIANLVPTNITVTNNYVTKKVEWRTQGWTTKNLFELKNASQVLVENNIFENNWEGGQPGYAIVFTPRNQGGTNTWATVNHVTFRKNIVRHVAAVFNTLGTDNVNPSGTMNNILIEDNLCYDVSKATWGGNGTFYAAQGGDTITINHNTCIHDGNTFIIVSIVTTNFVCENNIVFDNLYGIIGADHGVGNDSWNFYFPSGVLSDNVIILVAGKASSFPAGNYFPTTIGAVGFTNYAGGDYTLTPTSPYIHGATDGSRVGYRA